MKKVILIILSTVLGAALVLGGGAFGAFMYDMTIPHFDNYQISNLYASLPDDVDYKTYTKMLAEDGYAVNYPDFWFANNFVDELLDCYQEVQDPVKSYAQFVARKYNNRARLDPEVEYTKTRLTIKFTGYGVLEDGTREDLARTYIFDIEGASSSRLPKLINKADIYEELLGC